MSRTHQRWAFILILMFAVVLAACQPAATPTPTPRPTATAVPPTTESTEVATVEAIVPTEEVTEAVIEETEVAVSTEEATTEMLATEEPTEEMTAEATAEMTPEVGDIVEVAGQAGEFTTLLSAIDKAGLTDTLEGDGPFTVFAPTDAAFAALFTATGMTADDLLNNPDLAAILTYHVVAGKVTSDELEVYRSTDNPDEIIVPTLNGEPLTITFADDGSAWINGVAKVTLTNVEASNGVIHVVDMVLMPPSMTATEEPTEEMTEVVMLPTEIATEEVTEAAVVEEIVTPEVTEAATEEMTEMAPTEEATEVVLPTETPTQEATLELTPEATPELGSIIEIADQAGEFTTLLAALDKAGLTETLEGDGPFTVFAPTDDAFETLVSSMDATTADLLDRDDLAAILKYHVVEGAYTLDDLKALEPNDEGVISLPTFDDKDVPDDAEPLEFTVNADGELIINDTVKIVVSDVEAGNGIIHVIDAVLLPPSVEAEMTPEPTAES